MKNNNIKPTKKKLNLFKKIEYKVDYATDILMKKYKAKGYTYRFVCGNFIRLTYLALFELIIILILIVLLIIL